MDIQWRNNINFGLGLALGAFVFADNSTLSSALLWGAYGTLLFALADCFLWAIKRLPK